ARLTHGRGERGRRGRAGRDARRRRAVVRGAAMSRALFDARLEAAERAVNEDLAALSRREHVDPLVFAAHHRELATALSLARHRRYDQALVARLNALVVEAHATLHRAVAGRSLRAGLEALLV